VKFQDRARGIARIGTALALGGTMIALGGTAQATAAPRPTPAPTYRAACAAAAPGQARCAALIRTDVKPLSASAARMPHATVPGYGPSSLQSAYNITTASATTGAGETVAVVDAYNDPNADSDLGVYRSQFGLPACTVANGCLTIVSQTGSTTSLPPIDPPPSSPDGGWDVETTLDIDMVSAICPLCHIDLVEANTEGLIDLGTAVNEAVTLGAKFVSNSYTVPESTINPTTYDAAYYNHPGIVITAATGDEGYSSGVLYPASSPYVTAVGGTTLTAASSARGWTESPWFSPPAESPLSTPSAESSRFTPSAGGAGSGSGCSGYESKPTWQTDTGCTLRTTADVSAVADPATGVAVFDSLYGAGTGWTIEGGTSAATPIIASTYALAGTPTAGTYPASYPYAHIPNLYDVTTTTATGTCTPAYLCTGGVGYDGPTGLGTPDGTAAFTPGTGTGGLANAVQAYQGSNGHLWTARSAGTTDLSAPMLPGTSPSITALATGGTEIAYQGSNGDLWVTSISGDPVDSHLGMMNGTSPAIADAAGGGFNVAFQANTGILWDYTSATGRGTSLNQAMVTTTSPSICAPVGATGGYEIAYQGSNIDLWVTTISGTPIDSHLGMASGTNPSIAAASTSGFNATFQANTGILWDYTSATGRGTSLGYSMLTGTSPSITAQPAAPGGYEIAYLASGAGYLSTTSEAGTGTMTLSTSGSVGTAPAITTAFSGSSNVAFHAPSGDLWNYSPRTALPYDMLGSAMQAGTSPSIAP
jgi:hypothetical protein